MNEIISEEEKDKFLKELNKLTEKYNIKISGCGCCGSPRLMRSIWKGKYTAEREHTNDDDFAYLTYHKIQQENNK